LNQDDGSGFGISFLKACLLAVIAVLVISLSVRSKILLFRIENLIGISFELVCSRIRSYGFPSRGFQFFGVHRKYSPIDFHGRDPDFSFGQICQQIGRQE
jgi:hypothetical protein